VKLTHAIKVAEQRAASLHISAEEAVALRVLATMAKRVLSTRPSLRAVVRAVYGEDLNQTEMEDLFKQE
jgi:hypothetical protein